MAKKHDFWEQKNPPNAKKSRFFNKIFQKRWINDVLGHVCPILDDASDPPGHKKHLGWQNTLF
jgi:hypothetical protein